MQLLQRKHYIQAMHEFIEDDLRPNYFLTFNFNPSRHRAPQSSAELEDCRSISVGASHKMLTDFFNVMQESVFGKSWRRQTWRDWPTAVGFCEHESTNLHFHVYANICSRFSNGIKEFGSEVWSNVNPSGTFYYDRVYRLGGVLRYGLKEQWKLGKDESIFFYSDPRPSQLPNDLAERVMAQLKKALSQ